MKKRILSLLMAAAIIAAALPAFPASAQEVWDGIEKSEPELTDNVYQIRSGAELAWFAEYVNNLGEADSGLVDVDAVLTADIDLGNNPWTPIGLITYVVDAYAGTFDGGNHTVSGLKIDTSAANYGLFAIVNTGTVKNLKVEGSVNSNNVAGGIIGKLQTGTVENCSMGGSVTSTGKSTKGYAGGIIGTVSSNNAVISGCCNTAEISGTYGGGILGYSSNTVNISNCYNTGDITGTSRSAGIAGQMSKGSISYCYNIGNSNNGICGFSNAAITNCYYLNDEESEPGGTASGYEKISDKDLLLQNLNAGTEMLFREDSIGINNGYPILFWQLSSQIKSVPIERVEILGESVTGGSLIAKAFGENEEPATNVSYHWSVSDDKISFTDIDGATGASFDIPDTTEYFGKYIGVEVNGENGSKAFDFVGPVEKSETLKSTENAEKVKSAINSISLASIIKEPTILNLPTEIGECSAEWFSSNQNIISNDGVVTLPDKNIESVTLTVRVSCGSVSQSRQFGIDVWALDVDADVYLEKVLNSMKWDFKLLQPIFGEDTNIIVKFKNILKERGFDGVTVTVKSTADKNLISQNGKITYPAVPQGGSFANGKQVQVFFNLTVEDKTVVYPSSDIYSLLVPWNTADVSKSLEQSADEALTDEIIRAENTSLDSVSFDLNLPSCIDGNRFSFAWITWESSDPKHLEISDENRMNGADSLYSPYIGKIHQDGEAHSVVLTAKVTNPSTEITVTRLFEIMINPISSEQLEQNISKMREILDCYTADKLTDFVTKQRLNTNAVENDIQLVIPKNVVSPNELQSLNYGKYWDYWNYRFTVSSSDTDIIEVNSFRAYVYRPLGENSSCDKNVTLTVQMTSKSNPNLFVKKDISVTVKHLSRAEINGALDLMDRAKTEYSRGLLGSNSDIYSVIDNLTPYKEIIWNSDKTGVDFIYRNADMKNSGIVVDELPGWEEQENWRLFKTSSKDLISNETLILNETPEKDTFVKINSVLTDEVFGKYYTKFLNSADYNTEALAKFKQLYKQPVSTYVLVEGDGNHNEKSAAMSFTQKEAMYSASLASFKRQLDKPISVTFTLLGLNGAPLIAKTVENSFTGGATVFDVFKKVLASSNISYNSRGSYITSINGLSEFDHGKNSGWMYTVGSVFVNSYMNAQELYGGEDIVVMYVTDYSLANSHVADKPSDGESSDNSKADESLNNNSSGGNTNTNVSGSSKGDAAALSSPQTENEITKPADSADNTKITAENGAESGSVRDETNQNINTESESAAEEIEKSDPKVFIFIVSILIILLAIFILMQKKRGKENVKYE